MGDTIIIEEIELYDVNNHVVGRFKKPLAVELEPAILAVAPTGVSRTVKLKLKATTAQLIYDTPAVREALGLPVETTEENV